MGNAREEIVLRLVRGLGFAPGRLLSGHELRQVVAHDVERPPERSDFRRTCEWQRPVEAAGLKRAGRCREAADGGRDPLRRHQREDDANHHEPAAPDEQILAEAVGGSHGLLIVHARDHADVAEHRDGAEAVDGFDLAIVDIDRGVGRRRAPPDELRGALGGRPGGFVASRRQQLARPVDEEHLAGAAESAVIVEEIGDLPVVESKREGRLTAAGRHQEFDRAVGAAHHARQRSRRNGSGRDRLAGAAQPAVAVAERDAKRAFTLLEFVDHRPDALVDPPETSPLERFRAERLDAGQEPRGPLLPELEQLSERLLARACGHADGAPGLGLEIGEKRRVGGAGQHHRDTQEQADEGQQQLKREGNGRAHGIDSWLIGRMAPPRGTRCISRA